MISRLSRALAVVSIVSVVGLASCEKRPAREASAEATKPMSPADGTKDYDPGIGNNAMGPLQKPVVPVPSGEPAKPKEPGGQEPVVVECPPTCSPQGGWIGCGLTKIRGSKCQGCTPKCKGKGTTDEGWYDCAGVLIVNRPCGN